MSDYPCFDLIITGCLNVNVSAPCVPPCTFSSQNVIDTNNFSWQPPPALVGNVLSASFKFEDSSECGGSNGSIQTGTAECGIYLNTTTQVDLLIQGNVEGQSPGYDHSWILISGNGVPQPSLDPLGYEFHCQIKSNQYGQECQMFNTNNSASFVLSPGSYTIYFESNTNDGLHHSNMIHNFQVTLTPIT